MGFNLKTIRSRVVWLQGKRETLKALLKWIGPTPTRVVHEPTGPCHRKLEVRLAAADMPIAFLGIPETSVIT